MIHRINIFLLSLFIALAPTYIFAGSVASEGWSVTKRLVNGATTFYDGTKSVILNGKQYVTKGSAFIIPNSSQVGKMIVGTGAVLAVDLAIKGLLGAVDYVMDPANNRVKYFVTGDPANPKDPSVKLYYQVSSNGVTKYFSSNLAAATDLCTRNAQGYGWILVSTTPATFAPDKTDYQYATCVIKRNSTSENETFTWPYSQIINPAYDPNAQPNKEEKYLPYESVGARIISDANANNSDAKAYVSSVADTALEQDEQKQLVPAQDIINQFEFNKSIPTNNTATGTSTPTTGTGDPATATPPYDIKLDFPVFCDWAPTVCQAAQAAIEFPKTFVEKFNKWDDWLNRETKAYTYDETKLDTEDKRSFDFSVFNENRFNVDDKCPAPEPHTFTLAGQTVSFSFDLMPVCSILEMAKPALIAASYIYAAYIVIGASRG
ncbi:virulence factor TspB C-terminal domain-related protein (plasmid) [Acinetobacter baumannii]